MLFLPVFAIFQLLQNRLCTLHNTRWHARQLRNMDSITTSNRSRCYPMQENNASLLIIADHHSIDIEMRKLIRHCCQFMIVGGKQGSRSSSIMQMLYNGPRNRQSIVRTGATANLIENDQAVLCCMM